MASPYPSSGQVGQTIAVQNLALTLTSNVTTVCSSTILGKGVWAVTSSTLITIPTGTTLSSSINVLFGGVLVPPNVTGPIEFNRVQTEPLDLVASTLSANQQYTNSCVITVTEDNYTLQNAVRYVYTGGTGILLDVFNSTSGVGSLYCVKLA